MKSPVHVLPPLLLAGLLLAGCSFFAADQNRDYSRAGASDAERIADFESCKEQARAIVARDQTIDQDIASGSAVPSTGASTDTSLQSNLGAYRAQQRYDRLLDECMRERGYGPVGN
jgi:plasmid stabilization system protein ParE